MCAMLKIKKEIEKLNKVLWNYQNYLKDRRKTSSFVPGCLCISSKIK